MEVGTEGGGENLRQGLTNTGEGTEKKEMNIEMGGGRDRERVMEGHRM